jgi:hypothetical protein
MLTLVDPDIFFIFLRLCEINDLLLRKSYLSHADLLHPACVNILFLENVVELRG